MFALIGKRMAIGSGVKSPRRNAPGKRKAVRSKATKTTAATEAALPEDRAASTLDRIRKRLDQGETRAALDLYAKSRPTWKSWGWSMPEADLMRLIKAGMTEGLEAETVPLMFDFCRKYPERADRIRLKLAQVLIEKQERPARALRLLGDIATGELSADLDRVRRRLASKAQAMLDEGALELEADD